MTTYNNLEFLEIIEKLNISKQMILIDNIDTLYYKKQIIINTKILTDIITKQLGFEYNEKWLNYCYNSGI